MNRTTVMASVASDRCTPGHIAEMRGAGMESVRINSAHVTPDEMAHMVETIRGVDPDIKILIDTKGAEVRTTAPKTVPAAFTEGAIVSLSADTSHTTSSHIGVRADISSVAEGTRILIDDGAIELNVTDNRGQQLTARVIRGGIIDAAKTITFVGAVLPGLTAVTERDRLAIATAKKLDIDMIAHSYVRSAADIEAVRRELGDSPITLYAKIETKAATECIGEILAAADGLLVARGDLGTQIPLEALPAVQFKALKACRAAGKPSIVATQILASMMDSPSPLRAELSDIALAVMEGADCLLLTGETARGNYPAETVGMLRRVIEYTTSQGLRCLI